MNGSSHQPLISAHAIDCSQVADWSREVGWDIEYQQVGRGAFDAWFCFASCQELRLTNQVCNREMVICGCPPRDMLAMVLPSGRDHLGIYEGRTLSRNDRAGMGSAAGPAAPVGGSPTGSRRKGLSPQCDPPEVLDVAGGPPATAREPRALPCAARTDVRGCGIARGAWVA